MKKIKLPKEFEFLGISHKISYHDIIPGETSTTAGIYYGEKNEIAIKKDTQEVMLKALIHEVFHGIAQNGMDSILPPSAEGALACYCEYPYGKLFKQLLR